MTTAPDATSRDAEVGQLYSPRQIRAVMVSLMLGMLLAALDQTIAATALPTVVRDLQQPNLYTWVVTSYLITSAAATPLWGKLGDVFGRKRLFEIALVIFLGGSVLSGVSRSMLQLILFRGVQGVGAAGLLALALTIVGDVVPARQRGRYQGYFGLVFGAASVLGPLIGGIIVDTTSWRWIFYVNVPLTALALAVINRTLRPDGQRVATSIDWTGAALLVAAVSLFLIGVQNVGDQARLTVSGVYYLLGGLLLAVVFVLWERLARDPVLPLRLFGNDIVRVSSTLGFILGGVMFGSLVLLPRYIQTVKDVSPTLSGLWLLPMTIGLLATSIASGRLVSRFGRYKPYVVAGTAVATIGVALLTTIRVGTSELALSGILFVLGCGLGLIVQLTVLAAQNAVDRADLGIATASVTFFRSLGGAVSTSVLGAVLIAQESSRLPQDLRTYGSSQGSLHAFTSAMDTAYLCLVPVALIAMVVALFLREAPLDEGPGSRPINPSNTAGEK